MRNLIALFCFFPCIGFAQNSLLYRISEDGNSNISYLFGTMHTSDSLLNTFDKTWWNAFDNCNAFVGEVNATDTVEMVSAFNESLMKDTSLSDLYSEDELDRVRKYVLSKVEPPMAMVLMRMKPFYIMASIIQTPDGDGPFHEVMDLRLQRIASENGKLIIGLESNKEQVASVGAMSLKDQAKMLLEFVDEGEGMGRDQLIELEKYYQQQQLMAMYDFTLNYNDLYAPEAMMESLVDERNNRFMERLLPLLKSNTVFCAVGALHLPGEKGMINQLRKNGYSVDEVVFKFEQP